MSIISLEIANIYILMVHAAASINLRALFGFTTAEGLPYQNNKSTLQLNFAFGLSKKNML